MFELVRIVSENVTMQKIHIYFVAIHLQKYELQDYLIIFFWCWGEIWTQNVSELSFRFHSKGIPSVSGVFSGAHYLDWCPVVHLGSGVCHAKVSSIRNGYENLIIFVGAQKVKILNFSLWFCQSPLCKRQAKKSPICFLCQLCVHTRYCQQALVSHSVGAHHGSCCGCLCPQCGELHVLHMVATAMSKINWFRVEFCFIQSYW